MPRLEKVRPDEASPAGFYVLGAGGGRPRIELRDAASHEMIQGLDLKEGHSVYAMDLSPNLAALSFGTRRGGLYHVPIAEGEEIPSGQEPIRLRNDAAILAVCHLGGARCATSDASGQCLLWNLEQSGVQPWPLLHGNDLVCSLAKLPGGVLAGLSTHGLLYLWPPPHSGEPHTFSLLAPAELRPLVKLTYWPAARALVYPCQNGNLGRFDLERNQWRPLPAHEGDFYACAIAGDALVTIGMEDGRLKAWSAGAEEPTHGAPAPTGIIAAGAPGHSLERLLLIHERGEAAIYSLSAGHLAPLERLGGAHYRVCVIPPPEALEEVQRRRKDAQARQLALRLKEKVAVPQFAERDQWHTQLIGIGYEHVSLELQAEEACARQDLVGELGCRRQLASLLSAHHFPSSGCLARYAQLLEEVWLPEEARRIYEIMACAGADQRWDAQIQALSARIEIMNGDQWVIASGETPLEVILRGATILEKAFRGRYLLQTLPPQTYPETILTAPAIARQFQRMQREQPPRHLLRAKAERFYFLSRHDGLEPAHGVLFRGGAAKEHEGLVFALQVHHDGLQTVLIPHTMFDTGRVRAGASFQEHNQGVWDAYQRILRSPTLNEWLWAVHRRAHTAVEELKNLTIHSKLYGKRT